MLFEAASVCTGLVYVAMYHRWVAPGIVCDDLPPLSRSTAEWLWSNRGCHASRLRGFSLLWLAVVCLLDLSRLVPELIGAFQLGPEVPAQLAGMNIVVTVAVLVICVATAAYVGICTRSDQFELAVHWVTVGFVLLSALDFFDPDRTELDLVRKAFRHLSIIAGMVLTLFPASFALSICRVSARAMCMALVAADVVVLYLAGLHDVIFSVGLLCVGIRCVYMRLDVLELSVYLNKAAPDALGDKLQEMRAPFRRQNASDLDSGRHRDQQVPRAPCPSSAQGYGGRPIRILSIDGGGSKGIGVFKALDQIESSLGRPLHELYDYFIGSSIGGAVLLGKLVGGFSFDEFSARLVPAMAEFSRGQSVIRLLFTGATQTIEGTSKFLGACMPEEYLHKPFDGDAGKCHSAAICVTTSRHNADGSNETFLVSNYGRGVPWTVGEACRATTSFPTVCPPFYKDGQEFLDGGLLANNPGLEACHETGMLFPDSPIAIFHSVGMSGMKMSRGLAEYPPGPPSDSTNDKKSLLHTTEAIFTTIAETAGGTRHVKALLDVFFPRAAFRRLDLPLAHHGVFIGDEAEYATMVAETDAFLGASSVFQEMLRDHVEFQKTGEP